MFGEIALLSALNHISYPWDVWEIALLSALNHISYPWDVWEIALLSALNHISYPWDVWGDSTSLCIEAHILSVGCLGG